MREEEVYIKEMTDQNTGIKRELSKRTYIGT
jgi:hypothetical protein